MKFKAKTPNMMYSDTLENKYYNIKIHYLESQFMGWVLGMHDAFHKNTFEENPLYISPDLQEIQTNLTEIYAAINV